MDLFSFNQIEHISETAEIKRLFTTLSNDFLNATPKSLLITSALQGEGKTTITALLASAAARYSDFRVLAVDFNWYKPALHTCFGLNLTFGKDIFKDKNNISDLAQPSGLDRLDILTAPKLGTNNSCSETKNINLEKEIIKKAQDNYDFIVIDSAPLFPINRYMVDPVTISSVCDGVALVALTGKTARHETKRAKTILGTAKTNLVGVVNNHWANRNFK